LSKTWIVQVPALLTRSSVYAAGRSPGHPQPNTPSARRSRWRRRLRRTSPAEPPASGGKSDGSGNADPFDFGVGARLPECVAGFRQSDKPERRCNCLVQGVCFDDKAQACACICPRTGKQNACVSEQECEERSRTKVRCYSL
jgi:hypothetical protein